MEGFSFSLFFPLLFFLDDNDSSSITSRPYGEYYKRLNKILSDSYDSISVLIPALYQYKIFINTNIYDLKQLSDTILTASESQCIFLSARKIH